MNVPLIILAFFSGILITRYWYKICSTIIFGWYNFIGFCIVRPRMRYMERYIKRRGWYNPVHESKNPDTPGPWSSPDIWSHPNDKNPSYNELGYCLYAAYMIAKGKGGEFK